MINKYNELNAVQQSMVDNIIYKMLNPPVPVIPEPTPEELAEKALLAEMEQEEIVVYMTEKRRNQLEAELMEITETLNVLTLGTVDLVQGA